MKSPHYTIEVNPSVLNHFNEKRIYCYKQPDNGQDLTIHQHVLAGSYTKIFSFDPIVASFGSFCNLRSLTNTHIRIGHYCTIGNNVQIFKPVNQTPTLSSSSFPYETTNIIFKQSLIDLGKQDSYQCLETSPQRNFLTIKDDVRIGNNVSILHSVTIGRGAIILDHSIVLNDVEPYSIIAGNPAQIIGKRFEDGEIEMLEKSKWWMYNFANLQRDPSSPGQFLELSEEYFQPQYNLNFLKFNLVNHLRNLERPTVNTSRAPLNIIQYWDTFPTVKDPYIAHCMQTTSLEERMTHTIFNDNNAQNFLKEHYQDTGILEAYLECVFPAMKADLFRYAYLYKQGGIYADCDHSFHGFLPLLLNDHFTENTQCLLNNKDHGITNDFIITTPNNPFIKLCLEKALTNIQNKESNNVWEVTGPKVVRDVYHNHPELHDEIKLLHVTNLKKYITIHQDIDYKSNEHWSIQQKEQSIYTSRTS